MRLYFSILTMQNHALYARVFVKSDKSSYECYSTTPYHIW